MDWPQLITALQDRGLSLTQIAKACGAGQATISDLKLKPGREPGFSLGQRLIRLSKASDKQVQRLRGERAPTEPAGQGA